MQFTISNEDIAKGVALKFKETIKNCIEKRDSIKTNSDLIVTEKEKQEKATELLNKLYDLLDEGDSIMIEKQIRIKKIKDYIKFSCDDDWHENYWTYSKPDKCSY